MSSNKCNYITVVVILLVVSIFVFIGYLAYGFWELMEEGNPIPCDEQVPLEEVEALFVEHQDVVAQIQDIASTRVSIRSNDCDGEKKANVLIMYMAKQNKNAIQDILGGNTFYGVPIRWQNV